jgi:hypothetical protein
MYERTKGTNYLAYLDSWGEWAMYELARTKHGGMQHITYVEENKDQLWDDTHDDSSAIDKNRVGPQSTPLFGGSQKAIFYTSSISIRS